jgi:hypothetical protein
VKLSKLSLAMLVMAFTFEQPHPWFGISTAMEALNYPISTIEG